MISTKPYFFRAFYDWIVDNGWTPLILVDATLPDVQVPQEFVKDGKIVLNLSPRAVRDLQMENDAVSLKLRFGGVPHSIRVPMAALLSVYAEENGQMIGFPPDGQMETVVPPESPHLVEPAPPAASPRAVAPAPAKKTEKNTPPKEPAKGTRPTLRLIKDEPPVH